MTFFFVVYGMFLLRGRSESLLDSSPTSIGLSFIKGTVFMPLFVMRFVPFLLYIGMDNSYGMGGLLGSA